jgi:hypothetical protein
MAFAWLTVRLVAITEKPFLAESIQQMKRTLTAYLICYYRVNFFYRFKGTWNSWQRIE